VSRGDPIRRRGILLLKIAVTVLLCAVIVWKADWAAVGAGFRAADLPLIGVVFACMVACVTISAWKWKLLLSIHGARLPFNRLHRYYFIAMFFNNFLPTSIGGDGYRIYKTLDNQRSKTAAVLAVFMERLSGIASLLVIGVVCGAIGYFQDGHPLSRLALYAGVVGAAVGLPLLAMLIHPRTQRWIRSRPRLPGVIRSALEHLDDYGRRPRLSALVVLVSFGFHLFTLAWWLLLVRALGGSLSLTDLAVVAAVLSIVAVIPLSINGIGLVDGSFIYLSGQFGLDYDTALMFMLAQRALLIPISLAGGLLYLAQRDAPAPGSVPGAAGVTEAER
jgi:hypothetical protein